MSENIEERSRALCLHCGRRVLNSEVGWRHEYTGEKRCDIVLTATPGPDIWDGLA